MGVQRLSSVQRGSTVVWKDHVEAVEARGGTERALEEVMRIHKYRHVATIEATCDPSSQNKIYLILLIPFCFFSLLAPRTVTSGAGKTNFFYDVRQSPDCHMCLLS
jgi:hypothetical protein